MAALATSGIISEGQRKTLGLNLGGSESEASWNVILKELKGRRDLIVSDDHKGLKNAVWKHFQGVRWQCDQAHFLRNILGHAPLPGKDLPRVLSWLFPADSMEEARTVKNKIFSNV